MVCMLLLCCYTKTLNTEPGLLAAVTASSCCAHYISLRIKSKRTNYRGRVLWGQLYPPYMCSAALILLGEHCLTREFASSQVELCLEAACLHAGSSFSMREHKTFFFSSKDQEISPMFQSLVFKVRTGCSILTNCSLFNGEYAFETISV